MSYDAVPSFVGLAFNLERPCMVDQGFGRAFRIILPSFFGLAFSFKCPYMLNQVFGKAL